MRTTGWLLAAMACGGKDDGKGGSDSPGTTYSDPPSETTEAISVLIDAESGGTVEAFGAELEIPPGALSADTAITVSVRSAAGLPEAATVVGQAFDFGPDGTTFSVPATLTLPVDGTPGTGASFVVSWLDGAAWTDLPSTAGADTVVGSVAHFTSFAARLVAGNTGSTPGGAPTCGAPAACGGDLVGTWIATSRCSMDDGPVPFTCEVPFVETAPPGGAGALTFAADGTVQGDGAAPSTAPVVEHVVPAACIPPGVPDCAGLYAGAVYEDPSFADPPSCTGDVAKACTCTEDGSDSTWEPDGLLSWTSDTDTVRISNAFGDSNGDQLYCVAGDALTIWDGSGGFEAYTRAP